MIVYGEPVTLWLEKAIGTRFVPPFTSIGWEEDGTITAGFLFNMYTTHDVEVTLAATRIPRALMKETFAYVVNTLGCRRATFRTRADNYPAQKALHRLGAKLEGKQRLYFGDCDCLIYGILKEDFPFVG